MNFDKCTVVRTDPIIVAEESGRKFIIRNDKRLLVSVIRIDGCLILGAGEKRCDYLFEIGPSFHCAIYLELKGADIARAFQQLAATLLALKPRPDACSTVCHIVASRVPKLTPSVQQAKLRLARDHRALAYIGTTQVAISLTQVPYAPPAK